MKVGYIRISTIEQNTARQYEMMKEKGIEKYFENKCSGKNINRKALNELMEFIREGDVVYIESFSRLARSTKDLLDLVEYFTDKKVNLISLKENLDSTTATGKLMLTMIGSIATFERDCMLERQSEGIAIAKQNEKYKGRKKIKFPTNWVEIYKRYKHREITGTKAMEILNLRRNTFYSLIKEYENTNKFLVCNF
ncbi:recombinase family protein [Clostridium paridis]|uniref:Recombinase family protein n=1 Tax=Clostridium paridis TaxID=2803863 RepID=A0A937FKH0_9CLOT|nr:recombinase family protein [Clostridium paridis]MBL4933531.1 recombinase family protein [Clostridium paridis]